MKKNAIIAVFLIFFTTTSCGFKVVKKNEIFNFDINKIYTSGDNRINYKIKSKILFKSEKNEKKLVDIYLNTKKIKTIKEKNINNEITKYLITIKSDVKIQELTENKTISFFLETSGDYSIAKQNSQTLSNEKKLIELLTNDLAENIIDKLVNRINDL